MNADQTPDGSDGGAQATSQLRVEGVNADVEPPGRFRARQQLAHLWGAQRGDGGPKGVGQEGNITSDLIRINHTFVCDDIGRDFVAELRSGGGPGRDRLDARDQVGDTPTPEHGYRSSRVWPGQFI